MGRENQSPSMEAVVNMPLIMSIAGMIEEWQGVNIEKHSVPSFSIYT
jgi:hypothetical protein